jgi:hypothetical protein
MSKEMTNKAIVGRWFTEFWGEDVNLAVVDEIAAPNEKHGGFEPPEELRNEVERERQ